MMGEPAMPLAFEKNSHVLLCIVLSGPRWNWRIPSLTMPSLSGRLMFMPELSHWMSFWMAALFLTSKGTVYAQFLPARVVAVVG